MGEFASRLKAAMLARGMEATPENLARACRISLEDAVTLMSVKELPPVVGILATVCRCLQVRMVWMANGESVPVIASALRAEEIEALELLSSLSDEEVRRWLQVGRQLAKL